MRRATRERGGISGGGIESGGLPSRRGAMGMRQRQRGMQRMTRYINSFRRGCLFVLVRLVIRSWYNPLVQNRTCFRTLYVSQGEIVEGEKYKAGNKGRAIVLLHRLNSCIRNFVRILEVIPVERI